MESFRSILQMCRKQTGSLSFIKKVHLLICGNGLETLDIGNMLVQIYVEHGHFSDAIQVFRKLINRSELSWTCLIQGYNDNEDFHNAFQVFSYMQEDCVNPSKFTYVALLKSCAGEKDVEGVLEIHSEVIREYLEVDLFICNTLVSVYAKCGSLLEATKVFESLSVSNIISWTALIQGYSEHCFAHDALRYFGRMQIQGQCPNAFTYSSFLKACGNANAVNRGKQIHGVLVVAEEFNRDLAIDNALLYMYAKVGLLVEVEKLFKWLPTQDVITWTALIAGCAENGSVESALYYYKQMQCKGVPINPITCVEVLKACSSFSDLEMGRDVHIDIIKRGYDTQLFVGNALVDMYAKSYSMLEARVLFDRLKIRSIISWNTLLGGYCDWGLGKEALLCLEGMQRDGVSRSDVTLICALRACGIVACLDMGREIHAEITKEGFEGDYLIGNSLVEMYTKSSAFEEAKKVLLDLPVKSTIAWTAIISYYVEHGLYSEVLNVLESMQQKDVYLDVVAFLYGLQACGCTADQARGQELHMKILKQGIERDLFVGNSLVDMYGKCYLLEAACYVFYRLSEQSVVSWSALIAGHVENGLGWETLSLLEKMQLRGSISPNAAIFVSSLKACSIIGALSKGQKLHCELTKKGFISLDAPKPIQIGAHGTSPTEEIVGNALIDMYAKCGSLVDAMYVFYEMHGCSIATWNTLISAFMAKGRTELVFHCFEKVSKEEQIHQNEVTFLMILNGCSHAGLVEKGKEVFMAMYKDYCVMPMIEHYNCMIDLFGRAGQVEEAVRVLEKMPLQPKMATWNAILAACQKWGNVELGEWVFECVSRLNENYTAAFISMYNIYSTATICREEDKD